MEGIQFLIDEKGNKKAVLIDLDKHGDLWEDFYDRLVYHDRINEPRETLSEVKEKLIEQKKLDG